MDHDSEYDGRRARRDRNRDAVVGAVADLLTEGEWQPTARLVAARSGVSLRSVFRYFEDLDALLAAAIPVYRTRHADRLDFDQPPPGTPLDERIERWIDSRLSSYPLYARTMIAAYARAREDERIMGLLEGERRNTIAGLEALFSPELAGMPAEDRPAVLGALHSATTIEAWVNLIDRHGLDEAAVRLAFRRLLRGALGLAPG